MVNKWASWCGPCRAEFGVFQRVSVTQGRGVAFLGIDSGDASRADAIAFLRAFPVSYPSYYDQSGQAGLAVTDSSFTPVTVFYNRARRRVHPPGPISERRQARTGHPALRAGGLTLAGDAHRPAQRAEDDRRRRAFAAAGRRADDASRPSRSTPSRDPFAEGHEDRTPPELYAVRPGGGPADSPGLDGEGRAEPLPGARAPAERRASAAPDSGRGAAGAAVELPATGAHEVIINGPQPVLSLADLPVEQVLAAVEAWRERMRAHEDSAYLQLIVNERREAGASLPHTHAQLYALDFVPAAVARERERASAYTTRTMGQSLLGDLVAEEVRRRERIVAIDEEAVLMAPYASRVPFQLMLAPRTPRARFEAGAFRGSAAARRTSPAGAASRLQPAAEPVRAHRAPRSRGVLLADRRAAAADASRGP